MQFKQGNHSYSCKHFQFAVFIRNTSVMKKSFLYHNLMVRKSNVTFFARINIFMLVFYTFMESYFELFMCVFVCVCVCVCVCLFVCVYVCSSIIIHQNRYTDLNAIFAKGFLIALTLTPFFVIFDQRPKL